MIIYCVEDDASIRDVVIYSLKVSGFQAFGFSDITQLYTALNESLPDLILLDIMLPKVDGITILKGLKSDFKTASIPVIMMTARGSEYDRVIGLDTGADDYLVKPFGMMEMVSRVKAVLRRCAPLESKEDNSPDRIESDYIVLYVKRHEVFTCGNKVDLTYKEFQLLRFFMQNPNHAFSRDYLLKKLWDPAYTGESRTVDMHVASLRNKLGTKAASSIKTIRGVGYIFEPNEHD